MIEECQSISWMALRSAHESRSVVAKECLRVWAEIFFRMNACEAYFFIIVVIKNLESLIFSSVIISIFSRLILCLINRGDK